MTFKNNCMVQIGFRNTLSPSSLSRGSSTSIFKQKFRYVLNRRYYYIAITLANSSLVVQTTATSRLVVLVQTTATINLQEVQERERMNDSTRSTESLDELIAVTFRTLATHSIQLVISLTSATSLYLFLGASHGWMLDAR
jgi:hypothetical protein